ncbi:MAG TPA: YggT family protein [Streptosporangiaceae bacterium]|nr:YggT family protein [Streptosporangiaceae bacterium]HTS96546.1 YggT family protein [Streptosporangiaceae bacterium]
MDIAKLVLTYLLSFYLLLLIGRLIISWIQAYSRSWHPSGIVLVIAEACYTATDPPLRLLRRYIPSIRLGSVALDLSFMLLFLVVLVLLQVVERL